MTLQQILYVLTISEYGSMNKAADVLYILQPTLTSSVRELENEIGISIFTRTGKGTIPTGDGEDFLIYARQLYQQYELLMDNFGKNSNIKRKFGVSSQHYSFAVKTFVETVKQFDMQKYEFAMREEKTIDVINDVSNLKSEIGVLYINAFNKKIIDKILRDNEIEFHPLIDCTAYVYIWKNIHWQTTNPSVFSSLYRIRAFRLSREKKAPFIFLRRY